MVVVQFYPTHGSVLGVYAPSSTLYIDAHPILSASAISVTRINRDGAALVDVFPPWPSRYLQAGVNPLLAALLPDCTPPTRKAEKLPAAKAIAADNKLQGMIRHQFQGPPAGIVLHEHW